MSPFDEAIALQPDGEGRFLGRTHPGYANMVGPFGGVMAAQALQAVLADPRRQGEPISLTVNFCAAMAEGEFTALVRPARTNRSTQHWTLELQQAGEVVMTGTVFTALRRDTWGDDEHGMPAVPPPADVALPTRRAPVPWIGRYEMRFITGEIPSQWDGSEQHDSTSQLWLRDAPPRPLDAPALAALSDVFFPRIWRRRATPVPIGTVSMTVYFHADAAALAATGSGYLLGQARAQAFRGGYFDQTAQLWNEAGTLLATSHQVVYYKS